MMKVQSVIVSVEVPKSEMHSCVRQFKDQERLVQVPDGLVCVSAFVRMQEIEGSIAIIEATYKPE